jgi:hypothetical protein
VLVVLALPGTAAFVRGALNFRLPLRILRIDISRVASLSPGLVAVEGETRAGGKSVTSPLSGTECAAYQLQVRLYDRSAESSDWRTVHWESELGECPVEGNGSVAVDPDGATP